MLEEKTHLPAVLQSLGCIAETAMPVFETRDSEIEDFIIKKILQCSNVCLAGSTKSVSIISFRLYAPHFFFLNVYATLMFQKEADDTKASWDGRSELCLLKVGHFGENCISIFLFVSQ